jgi:hypothetical protein
MKGRKEIAAAYGLAMTGSAMLTAKKNIYIQKWFHQQI